MNSPVKSWPQIVFALCSGLVLLKAIQLLWYFWSGDTSSMVDWGLSDPRGTAGQFFGKVVLAIFVGFSVLGLYWFYQDVWTQMGPFKTAFEIWENFKSDQRGKEPTRESPEAKKLVEDLSSRVPRNSRLGRAIQSWNDPSPESDAEMLIEGEANRCRQKLNLLQAVASILVLIGLVGNFFGLSEAVAQLPNLMPASVISASPTPTVDSTTVATQSGYQQTVKANDPSAKVEANSTARNTVSSISKGLSVVVVSSVLGIGGMIFLLLFVAFFRMFFNHLVGEEVLLLAAEIGSLVRSSSGGGKAETMVLLGKSLEKLEPTMANLDNRLMALQKKEESLSDLTSQLDKVLLRHLQAEDAKFTQFKQSLDELRDYLVSSNEGVSGFLKSATDTGTKMDAIAGNLKKVAESLVSMVETQKGSMTDLSAYAELVKELASDEKQKSEQRYKDLVTRLSNTFGESSKEWLDSAQKSREDSTRIANSVLKEGSERTERMLELLSTSNGNFAKKLEDLTRLQTEAQSEFRGSLESVRQDFVQGLAKELSTTAHNLEKSLKSAMENQQTTSASVLQSIQSGFSPLQAAVDALVKSAGEQHTLVSSESKLLGQQYEKAVLAQTDSAKASRDILNEGQKTLESTRMKILEIQDHWQVSLEGLAQELFARWHDQQSPNEGNQLQEVMAQHSSKISQLVDKLQAPMPIANASIDLSGLEKMIEQQTTSLVAALEARPTIVPTTPVSNGSPSHEALTAQAESAFATHMETLVQSFEKRLAAFDQSTSPAPLFDLEPLKQQLSEQSEKVVAALGNLKQPEAAQDGPQFDYARFEEALSQQTHQLAAAIGSLPIASSNGELAPSAEPSRGVEGLLLAPTLKQVADSTKVASQTLETVRQGLASGMATCGACGHVVFGKPDYCPGCGEIFHQKRQVEAAQVDWEAVNRPIVETLRRVESLIQNQSPASGTPSVDLSVLGSLEQRLNELAGAIRSLEAVNNRPQALPALDPAQAALTEEVKRLVNSLETYMEQAKAKPEEAAPRKKVFGLF